jgi:hypothetical protein
VNGSGEGTVNVLRQSGARQEKEDTQAPVDHQRPHPLLESRFYGSISTAQKSQCCAAQIARAAIAFAPRLRYPGGLLDLVR